MASLRNFSWHERELKDLLAGPTGPVARDLLVRGIRVESAAKQYASGRGGGPNVRTGRLRGSITHALGEDGKGLYCDIGSNVVYAPYVELGTSRMSARPYLVPSLMAAR